MTVDTSTRNRNRGLLIAIFVLFFGSMLVAGLLRFSGWRPAGSHNNGELLDPPGDLRGVTPRLVDGSAYPWKPIERRWRIAVAPPGGCGAPCDELAQRIDTVWQLFGKDADDVDVLWIGEPPAVVPAGGAWRMLAPDPAVRAGLPRVDDPAGVPVYVIDPNGFVILRYAPGFDPGGLRKDVSKLLKLR
ncbi:hypothetical protein [Lysobacter sp. A3-1-A15]|uniref:hypothetical protein n=1 Tax=Novilysobacter viscosus TaxID=3098602 RepID=UPI002EDB8886